MQLPIEYKSNLIVHIDAYEKFVNRTKKGLVLSLVNRADGSILLQNDSTLQPSWVASGINNAPSIVFSGNQKISCSMPKFISGINIPLVTILTAKCNDPNPDGDYPFMIGNGPNGNGNSALTLVLNNVLAAGARGEDDGLLSDSTGIFTLDATKTHVYTIIFDAITFTLRIDGKTVASAPVVANGFVTLDQLTIGSVTDGFGFDSFFIGQISELVIYKGSTFLQAEDYMLGKAGIGTNWPYKI